jgi:hypothetical protein
LRVPCARSPPPPADPARPATPSPSNKTRPNPTKQQQGTKINSKGKEVPHGVRLYSIASSRYGDAFDGQTTSLCVRRATYWCPELNAEDPAKKGICSNFLCDATPGTEISMTGALSWLVVVFCSRNVVLPSRRHSTQQYPQLQQTTT